jgi:hypothetical protein
MPKTIPPLSEPQVDNVPPGEKPFTLFDGGGLFLLVQPNGKKLWRFKYRFCGREKQISFGSYPDVSLSDARLQRNEARLLLGKDIDPSADRKEKRARIEAAELMAGNDRPSVRAIIDGTFEIWKGRSVLRLTRDEAEFVRDLLNKLL